MKQKIWLVLACLAGVAALPPFVPSAVAADPNDQEQQGTAASMSVRPRWLTGAMAAVPGVVLHGAGTWMAGDRAAAKALLTAEGVGLGLAAVGLLPLILTDASGQNVDLSVSALIAGTGLVVTSWMADVYGAAVGARPDVGPSLPTVFEAYGGYAYVYDPQFDYRHFSVLHVDARLGRWRLSPRAWIATNSDNQQLGMDAAFRLVGPRPDAPAVDGSYLDVQVGATHHRFGDERFSILTAEVLVPARLDLRRLGPSLAGSFVDLHLGWAFQAFDYWLPGRGLGTDINAVLLARFGFGVYFGAPGRTHGEVELYYDHRHDGLTGGLALDAHDPQLLGHVGLAGTVVLSDAWAISLVQEIGSASVSSLGLSCRWGGRT